MKWAQMLERTRTLLRQSMTFHVLCITVVAVSLQFLVLYLLTVPFIQQQVENIKAAGAKTLLD